MNALRLSAVAVVAELMASKAAGEYFYSGDEMLPRHVAEQVGAVGRSPSEATQSIAARYMRNAR